MRGATSARQALLCGAVAAATTCFIGYYWIAQTAHDFGMVPWPVAGGALLAFALIGEINLTLFAVALWWLRKPLARLPAAWTAALFTLTELITPKVFPDVLAHSQIDVPAMASATALVGQYGVGFVIAWFSTAVANSLYQRRHLSWARRLLAPEVVFSIAVALALGGYGWARQRAPIDVERQLDVVLVQTNVGDPIGLVNRDVVASVIDSLVTAYVGWTREAIDGKPADIILWPETAVPASPRHGAYYKIQRLAIETDTPVVTGGYDFRRNEDNQWNIYNAMFWIDTEGAVRGRYHKKKLIPIGETIPFESVWPQLRSLLPNAGEFKPGQGPQVMEIKGVRFAPLICYELIFPRYARSALKAGGEVFLNVSNDYWFGQTAEPQQHLALARMRAYETGRPILRCTNTGISALIDSHGQVILKSGIWRQETLRGTLAIPKMSWTPYARWGELMLLAFLVSICATTLVLKGIINSRS